MVAGPPGRKASAAECASSVRADKQQCALRRWSPRSGRDPTVPASPRLSAGWPTTMRCFCAAIVPSRWWCCPGGRGGCCWPAETRPSPGYTIFGRRAIAPSPADVRYAPDFICISPGSRSPGHRSETSLVTQRRHFAPDFVFAWGVQTTHPPGCLSAGGRFDMMYDQLYASSPAIVKEVAKHRGPGQAPRSCQRLPLRRTGALSHGCVGGHAVRAVVSRTCKTRSRW